MTMNILTSGPNSLTGTSSLSTPVFTGLSPDALLEYCQSQLGGLDGEINGSIKHQNLELQEREAAEQAQGVLEQFGDQGPQDGPSMQKCVDSLNTAISGLPSADPVAAQLTKFRDDMCSKYGFTPATTLATPTDVQAGASPAQANAGLFDAGLQGGGLFDAAPATAASSAAPTTANVVPPKDPTNKPQNNDWKGTCDALGNIVGDIKSNSEIQMLQLQDLVSQRQQAVSLATGMMSKEDQSLEQLARLGQG
jgi:hypothetical protein